MEKGRGEAPIEWVPGLLLAQLVVFGQFFLRCFFLKVFKKKKKRLVWLEDIFTAGHEARQ